MKPLGKILYIIGLGAVIIGGFDASLVLRGTRVPENVTIEQLGANDGTNNVHLTVSDYQFGDGIVIEGEDDEWRRVWIPMLTPKGEWTDRPVVLHSGDIPNDAELRRVLNQESVTGIVSNFRQSLGRNQQEQFSEAYPEEDLDGAICIELNGRFPSPYVAFPVAIFGAVTFLTGIGLAFGLIGRSIDEGMTSEPDPSPGPAQQVDNTF